MSAIRVCFLHVPKTAGTTIVNLMSSHFGSQNVFQIVEHRLCTIPISYLMKNRPIVTGHLFARYLSNEVLENSFVFTFLRDPVERVLSQYYYYRAAPAANPDPNTEYARTYSLKELLKKYASPASFSAWANWQTCIFSGCRSFRPANDELLERAKHNLEQLGFVGVQEELAAGADALLRAWGEDNPKVDLPRLNQTKERLVVDKIDEETRTLIEQNNALDRQLYDHARELWRKRHTRSAAADLISDLTQRTEEGSREIEIISFAIEGDLDNRLQILFRKPWTLLLTIRSHIVEENLTIGINISDEAGFSLYGTNSCMQSRTTKIGLGESVVCIDFAPMHLIPGRYLLAAALHTGLTSEEKLYHWIDGGFEFEIISSEKNDFIGVVDLGAKFHPPQSQEN